MRWMGRSSESGTRFTSSRRPTCTSSWTAARSRRARYSIRLREPDASGLPTEGGDDGDGDEHDHDDAGERDGVIVAALLRDMVLQRRVDRGEQIAELIRESGECAAQRIWRQL